MRVRSKGAEVTAGGGWLIRPASLLDPYIHLSMLISMYIHDLGFLPVFFPKEIFSLAIAADFICWETSNFLLI